MITSSSLEEENSILINKIASDFEKSLVKISYFNLWYRISKFFSKKVELTTYSKDNKDYIYFIDRNGVENKLSVYNAVEKWISGTVMELIFWEEENKEIIFFSEGKMYNIIENSLWKIIETNIIEDLNNIYNVLDFFYRDISYIYNKVQKNQSQLRERWILTKKVSDIQIEKFKINFKHEVLHLA